MNALDHSTIEKAGNDNGWEVVLGRWGETVKLGSARHPGRADVRASNAPDRWTCTFADGLAVTELRRRVAEEANGDGSFTVKSSMHLGMLLRAAAVLLSALPDEPAKQYAKAVKEHLDAYGTSGTEAEAIVKRRIGQDLFRKALMDYWGNACAITCCNLPQILRASHCKPWADCASDKERLDVFNGLLLTAGYDALFDAGLMTFTDTGAAKYSTKLTPSNFKDLAILPTFGLRWVAPEHLPYLAYHRDIVFES